MNAIDIPPQQILQQTLMPPLPPLRRRVPKLVLFRLDRGLILVGRPSEADSFCAGHRHLGWRNLRTTFEEQVEDGTR